MIHEIALHKVRRWRRENTNFHIHGSHCCKKFDLDRAEQSTVGVKTIRLYVRAIKAATRQKVNEQGS